MTQKLIREITGSSWDKYFIELATLISTKSKDSSTKVGVVIVGEDNEILSTGFNGFPRSVDEVNYPERWERPDKYMWIVHAEANAVANAARIGVSLKGSRMYMNYRPCPCSACASLIIQAGVKEIIGPPIIFPGIGKGIHYDLDNIAQEMLDEVKMVQIIVK
jgi:dCMP deaminase